MRTSSHRYSFCHLKNRSSSTLTPLLNADACSLQHGFFIANSLALLSMVGLAILTVLAHAVIKSVLQSSVRKFLVNAKMHRTSMQFRCSYRGQTQACMYSYSPVHGPIERALPFWGTSPHVQGSRPCAMPNALAAHRFIHHGNLRIKTGGSRIEEEVVLAAGRQREEGRGLRVVAPTSCKPRARAGLII